MTALLGKAGIKLFEKHLEQYAPQDPLYEFYTTERGKKKRRKRALPPGLSARDAKILKSIKRRAHYLDKGFSILGFRFGWTFIIGLMPVVGDAVAITMNYYFVVRKARQADIPSWLLRRMLMNNAISATVGFIPVAGDLVLAIYKANSRNAALLEEFLRVRGEEFMRLKEGEGLVDVPSGKKKGKGVSKKDAEQIKPGSGAVKGEVIPIEPILATAGPSSAGPVSKESPPHEGRRSFGSYFSRSSKSPAAKGSNGEKSKFVENIGHENC